MNVIDLFAGAGGLSEGFRQTNYEILAHVEVDSNACDTLRTREAFYYLKQKNMINKYKDYLLGQISRKELYKLIPSEVLERVIEEEISDNTLPIIFNKIDSIIDGKEIDMIIGGPPCQAYSTAGKSRSPNRMQNDPRNYFYLFYKQFLDRYNPRLFLFENVKGILTTKNGKIFDDLKSVMKKAGYKIDFRILNAKHFGAPQNRERVIIIGWKMDFEFEYPAFNIEDSPTITETFDDLPSLVSGECIDGEYMFKGLPSSDIIKLIRGNWNILTQHEARPHNERDLEIYRRVVFEWNQEKKLLKYDELPITLQSHKNNKTFLDRYKSLKPNEVSHTVVAHIAKDGHYYIHPDIKQNRSISVREAARIQTFPDNFYFERSRTAAFKQIGNAVPPLMAKKIAEKLKPFLI